MPESKITIKMTKLPAIVWKEGNWYVSWNPNLDIASQGKTEQEARKNLQEAVELYLEDPDAKRPSEIEVGIHFINVPIRSHARVATPIRT